MALLHPYELVATTVSKHDEPPPPTPVDAGSRRKIFSPVGNHPLATRWKDEILPAVKTLNTRGTWTSIHCLRLGHDPVGQHNPVTILIIATLGSIDEEAGEQLVHRIKSLTSKLALDVEVELHAMSEVPEEHEPLGESCPLENPPNDISIGASFGRWYPGENACPPGTFGAYLSARSWGDDELLALTCDHVCIDKSISESSPYTKINMYIPALADFKTQFDLLSRKLADHRDRLEKLVLATMDTVSNDEIVAIATEMRAIDEIRAEFDSPKHVPRQLGVVSTTGGPGRLAPSLMPMDWAAIHPHQNKGWGNPSDLNKLPPVKFDSEEKTLALIAQKMAKSGRPNLSTRFDSSDGSLPSHITELKRGTPDPTDVYYKVGRTTHWTAGVFNECESFIYPKRDLAWLEASSYEEAIYTHEYDQWAGCLVWCFFGIDPEQPFGEVGDSGALVFDSKGRATGLFVASTNENTWYHTAHREMGFVISLEDILKDMEKRLWLDDVRLAGASA